MWLWREQEGRTCSYWPHSSGAPASTASTATVTASAAATAAATAAVTASATTAAIMISTTASTATGFYCSSSTFGTVQGNKKSSLYTKIVFTLRV